MKLKDFVVNSLPRSKSKKKKAIKKQQQQQQALSNANSNCQNQNENQNIPSPCSSVPSSPDVTLNKSLVTDDFHYLSKPDRGQPLPKGTYVNVNNLNVNEVNKKCQCYKHISPCFSPATSPYDRPLSDITPPGYSSDGNFNTIPRVRTRIKTNPWLPSPRTSTTDSPMSSEASSPTYASPQRLTFDNSFSSDNNNYGRYDPSIMCTLTRTKDRKTKRHRSDSDSVYSSDNDSLLHRSVMSDTDNSVHTPDGHNRLAYDVFGERLYSSTPRKPRRHQKYSSQGNSEAEQTVSDVSFEYEEAFESQMEPETLAAALGSRDSLEDFYMAEFATHTPTSRSRQQSPSCNSTLKFRPNLNKYYDDSCETDDTLCENSLRRRKLHSKSSQDSIDHTKASTSESEMDHERDGRGPSSHTGNNNKEAHNEMQESFDSAFESAPGTCSMSSSLVSNLTTTSESENPSDRRRLDEIRSSLSQKVRKLREEKLLVDVKIRQAQEEERIRAQEMARFQKQLTQYRKQLLLQTLRDLKSQLDNQSQRLQTAYSTVLDTKLHEIHQRNSGRSLGVDKATGMSH